MHYVEPLPDYVYTVYSADVEIIINNLSYRDIGTYTDPDHGVNSVNDANDSLTISHKGTRSVNVVYRSATLTPGSPDHPLPEGGIKPERR